MNEMPESLTTGLAPLDLIYGASSRSDLHRQISKTSLSTRISLDGLRLSDETVESLQPLLDADAESHDAVQASRAVDEERRGYSFRRELTEAAESGSGEVPEDRTQQLASSLTIARQRVSVLKAVKASRLSEFADVLTAAQIEVAEESAETIAEESAKVLKKVDALDTFAVELLDALSRRSWSRSPSATLELASSEDRVAVEDAIETLRSVVTRVST